MDTAQVTFKSKLSEYAWTLLWVLFGISLFTSKSGISIFGTILLLWSVFKIDWVELRASSWLLAILGFFPVAIIVSFISIGGSDASLNVIRGWPWPLYILPFLLLFRDVKNLKYFAWAMGVGLIVGCVKALEVWCVRYGWNFDSKVRVDSFWDIGRWAYFLSCSLVVLFGLIGNREIWSKANKVQRYAVGIFFVFALVFLILVNARAPWLAAIGALGVLGVSNKRYFKLFCGFLSVVAFSLMLVPGTMDRFKSSFSAKQENGVVTSSDASNAARFHMWKVNSDFLKENLWFGTGFDSAEKPMRDFLSHQGEDYVRRYVDREFSFHDQHNSYLWILVQLGVVFFIYFWVSIAVIVINALKLFLTTEDVLFKISFALVLNQLFVFMFYSSVSSYETLWLFPALLILASKNLGRAK